MAQYSSIKKQYPDAVLFFRMGDFYEMFYEDARLASEVLGLTLTSRAHGKAAKVPLAGFPYHSIDPYLSKMLKAGHKVAICEQIEDPKKAKGLVKRAVREVVTPGTVLSENVIAADSNNFLLSFYLLNGIMGMAGLDISTGEFFLTEGDPDKISAHAMSLIPKEVILSFDQENQIKSILDGKKNLYYTSVEDYYFGYEYAYNTLLDHFGTVSLKGFGSEEYHCGISAAGAALKYIQSIQDGRLGQIQNLRVDMLAEYMILDNATRKNLEILSPMNPDTSSGSLLSILDRTTTKMGARLLKSWLVRPLLEKDKIQKRLQVVEEYFDDHTRYEEMTSVLKKVVDIERITSKINASKVNGRDIRGLSESLKLLPALKKLISDAKAEMLCDFRRKIQTLEEITDTVDKALVDSPPVSLSEGGIIRDGFDKELDELRNISRKGKQWILELQEKEKTETGIPSLRIKYNRVFGYYIEVTNTHIEKVPDHYIRKQTLVNAERYITPDMKTREEQILHAEERIIQKEQELFHQLRLKIAEHTATLQVNARIIAHLDVFCGFARVARDNMYCKPVIKDGSELLLRESRHPVVEQMLQPGDPFIPNDHSFLHPDDQIHIITGPNMAGKSTFLRQVGLCVLMAQIGSFVPAEEAEIGIVDRIFTRVGAHDDLSSGESTFLVEMTELANIINSSTTKSLLLLDEIGRGTSTFDGLSIAWATVEYLHNTPKIAAKTLFATHYHEITAVSQYLPRVKNFHVQVKEWEESVLFLRKILEGTSDHSYGIHVARMAGVPREVTTRAREILTDLESSDINKGTPGGLVQSEAGDPLSGGNLQISLFNAEETYLREKLKSIDPDTITPKDAIQKLFELKQFLEGKKQTGDSTAQ